MKTIEKIISSPILILIIMIKDLKDFAMDILNIHPVNSISFDWWDFSLKLIIAIALWLVLRAFYKLRNRINKEMAVFNTISTIRSKRLFVKTFENIQLLRLPNETDAELIARMPEYGLFQEDLKGEYAEVKVTVQRVLKKETDENIDKLLYRFYGFNL